MPRKPRLEFPGAIYHIHHRGHPLGSDLTFSGLYVFDDITHLWSLAVAMKHPLPPRMPSLQRNFREPETVAEKVLLSVTLGEPPIKRASC